MFLQLLLSFNYEDDDDNDDDDNDDDDQNTSLGGCATGSKQ